MGLQWEFTRKFRTKLEIRKKIFLGELAWGKQAAQKKEKIQILTQNFLCKGMKALGYCRKGIITYEPPGRR